MAPNKPTVDLNLMLNTDRQRRKNEALAQKIFGKTGKGRRDSAPAAGMASRKPVGIPSLASRVGVAGVTKRSFSNSPGPRNNTKPAAGNSNADWTHDLHSLNNPAASNNNAQIPRGPRGLRGIRNDRLQATVNGSPSAGQFNIIGTSKPGISIRGLAGPFTVMAKNLAMGTTAADIESAMTPIGGVVLGCRLIAERPKVIAEIIFETKEGADNVVDTFNNQNADGNILSVYHKPSPPSVALLPQASPVPASAPRGPRADKAVDRSDILGSGYGSDRYAPRDRSRERRRDYNNRDEVVDGSYGFEDQMDTDNDEGQSGGGLYSDNLIGNRGRGRGNSRDRGRSYR